MSESKRDMRNGCQNDYKPHVAVGFWHSGKSNHFGAERFEVDFFKDPSKAEKFSSYHIIML